MSDFKQAITEALRPVFETYGAESLDHAVQKVLDVTTLPVRTPLDEFQHLVQTLFNAERVS